MGARLDRWAGSPWRLPAASGILLTIAHFGGILVPSFVAFVPMLFWIDARRERSLSDVARGAAVFGLVGYGLSLHWIYAMLWISSLAGLMYAGLLILFTAGAVAALTLAAWIRRTTGGSFAWLLPVAWIPFEWLRTWGDLRMTADHVACSLAGYPFLIQFADSVGPFGVGAFLLSCNGLIYQASIGGRCRRERRQAVMALVALALAVLAYDAWRWTHPPAAEGTLRVALVQPNIPLVLKWDPNEDERQERVLADLTRQAARLKPDLILWPESARPKPVRHWLGDDSTLAMPEVQRLAIETGAAILTGVEYARVRAVGDSKHYNAALVARPDGSIEPTWTAKVYLVPFTEGIPFRAVLGPVLEGLGGDLHWLSGGFAPGPPETPLPAAGRSVGVLVCYEQLYPDLSRRLRNAGAELQVVITNDAWFGRTLFQPFLADVVRMRAIETRTAFVRVANTGISGFVDPLGRYEGRTGLFVPAVEVRDVPLTRRRTLYTRTGDVAAWVSIAGLLLAAGDATFRARREPRGAE